MLKNCFDESVREGNEMFILMETLSVNESGEVGGVSISCEYPKVFPNEISDVPPKREVEFMIDLVPRTSPISMAQYRMSALGLKELKR